jgi:uncharacterized glyoxalase superfamily protein PhnB
VAERAGSDLVQLTPPAGSRALPLVVAARLAPAERARLERRARQLAWGGIAWHFVEFANLRFGDTFIALRHDPAHQDAPADEDLRLAQTGVGQFGVVVEDVDAVHAELEEHGVTVISGPADRYWGMRTLTFADPGGYTWGIAQDLPSATGS